MPSISKVNISGTEYDIKDTTAREGMLVEEAVSGSTPSITAQANHRYKCGTVSTLSFTPPASGICDVVFTSGSTATVLTVPNTITWANGFDPTSLEANMKYELNIMDGVGIALATEVSA